MMADESHSASLQGSVRRAHGAGMFALSTNNNNPQIPNVMNQFASSLLAAVFTLAASTSFAATTTKTADTNALNQTVLVQDVTTEGIVVMRAEVTLPDGTKSNMKKAAANMAQALVAYQNFIRTLPYGATLDRVTFTDGYGNVLFSAQG